MERDYLEDLGIGGRKILKMGIQEWGWAGMDWIDQTQDRDRWQVLVNMVVNLWVP